LNISLSKVVFAKTCQNFLPSAAMSGRNQHYIRSVVIKLCFMELPPEFHVWLSWFPQAHFLCSEVGKWWCCRVTFTF